MSRKPRIEYPHGLYHVIARGNRQERIFLQPADFSKYLSLIKRYKKRYEFLLYAYALMMNHVHLLIEVGDSPLSKIMQGLQQTYTQFFNWKYGKSGHVFQGRYKTLLCQKDVYLLELVRYIHLNPVRARIAKNLAEYPWIGHHAYLHSLQHPLIDMEFVFSMFHPDVVEARHLYIQFLKDGLNKNYTVFLDDTHEGRILGKQRFVQESRKHENAVIQSERSKPKTHSLAKICEVVCKHFVLLPDVLKSSVKIRNVVRARRILCHVARVYFDYSLKEISSFLEIDATAVSRYMGDVDKLMKIDRSTQRRVYTICSELKKELSKYQA